MGGVRPLVSENKLAILEEMKRLGYPVTSQEIRDGFEVDIPLEAVEYHLCTLVKAGVVRPLFGPEIYFQRISQGAVPSALTESKRTEH